jgi:hypothetical protein
MSRVKRLYRVTATYKDRFVPDGTVYWQRDYQSKRAAEERKGRLLTGFHYKPVYDHMNGFTQPDDVPPAWTVTIQVSDPVIWPAPQPEED